MRPGDWLAVHGCGGVGLSAVMIAASMGVNIAVDIDDATLAMASGIGAVATINAAHSSDVPDEIIHLTGGGAHASMDALGSTVTCRNSISHHGASCSGRVDEGQARASGNSDGRRRV